MPTDETSLHRLDKPLIAAGFMRLLPISLFVVAFGAAFGLAATQEGLDDSIIMLMSALVFAGASQFAALELWGTQVPLFTMLVTVFAINARHLLMGATLYPWLSQLPPARRYGAMVVASDANWAMAMQAFGRKEPGLGILFGGGLALWLCWVLGTWLGIYFGNAVGDPKSLGLDMVMGCFLLAMVVGGEKNLRMVFIWAVAAVSSLLAYWYLPQAVLPDCYGRAGMSIETDALGALLVVFAMALVTLATRWGGVWVMSFVPIGYRVKQFIHAMSGSVLVAIITPMALEGDLGARMALLTTAVFMLVLKKPLPAIAAGILAAGLIRQFW